MLEFYWAYADYEDNMKLVEDMVRKTAEAVDATNVTWHGNEIDLSQSFARKPILKLLKEATGQDLGSATNDKMKKLCKSHNIDVENNANYGQMLDALLDALVIPNLLQPTFVIDYPKAISPLAKAHRSGDPNLVERFELFIGGAEFANSFTELNDPVDQRERLEAQAQLREQGDEVAQLVDENFIQAMECGMPPTGGVGLGIDRLTMLLTEQHTIKDVILFPAMRTVDE
jgi:lysyl-tRNA synthetase class 2